MQTDRIAPLFFIKDQLVSLDSHWIMGILNVTPDSFHSDSRVDSSKAIAMANEMIKAGAQVLDIGGQSTRPGATLISAEEESKRVIPVIRSLSNAFPDAIISIDTFYGDVARRAIEAGASIINDVSGGAMDLNMFQTVAELKVPYILTHIHGSPQTMQNNPLGEQEVMSQVVKDLSMKIKCLRQLGVSDVWIDPGFGFGKSLEANFELLNRLPILDVLECPILVGLSRKSMINKTLNISSKDSLNGTTTLNTIALDRGVQMLRVHDVKEAIESIHLYKKLISE